MATGAQHLLACVEEGGGSRILLTDCDPLSDLTMDSEGSKSLTGRQEVRFRPQVHGMDYKGFERRNMFGPRCAFELIKDRVGVLFDEH